MEILTTKDKKKIVYDNDRVEIVNQKDLEAQKTDIEKRIAADVQPTDKELLSWAKLNYPVTDHSVEVKELERIDALLKAIK